MLVAHEQKELGRRRQMRKRKIEFRLCAGSRSPSCVRLVARSARDGSGFRPLAQHGGVRPCSRGSASHEERVRAGTPREGGSSLWHARAHRASARQRTSARLGSCHSGKRPWDGLHGPALFGVSSGLALARSVAWVSPGLAETLVPIRNANGIGRNTVGWIRRNRRG